MKSLLLLGLLCSGCMVDRTGQSATSRLARESAIQTSRVQEVEKLVRRMSARVSELEEVMSYRGEQDEMELENLEGILKIQLHFLELADRYDIPIVDNVTIDGSVMLVIRHVVETLRKSGNFDEVDLL